MSLAPGARLGPYEILAALGAGGMGEVYRATDHRIARNVAIKILPSHYVEDQDRLRRFEQEARAAGALNHPNILAIYDVGNENGSPYLVSELLEGETLREKLRAGALPQRRAIEYAIQLAHGLAAAHDKKIVHRDLKPENVFVTRDHRLKILDFGLAKLSDATPPSADYSTLQTAAPQSTPGTILGTIGYMSPEQVRGLPADHRADIFAFGAILYEMLSGRRAFSGNTPADTMSAILQQEPPEISEARTGSSPALNRIIRHCLEKDADQRFQSARDIGFALETLSDSSMSHPAQTEVLASKRTARRNYWKFAAMLFLLLAIGAMVSRFLPSKTEEKKLLELSVLLPRGKILLGAPVLSPDGMHVAFIAADPDGKESLWVRSLNDSQAEEIPETTDAAWPFWSPDGRMIAFFATGKLRKVDSAGGRPVPIADVSDPRGGSWSNNGTILFSPHPGDGLYRVPAGGGDPVRVSELDYSLDETTHRFPHFLPDGNTFLYFIKGQNDRTGIYLGSLTDRSRKQLVLKSPRSAVFSPPNYLFFQRDMALMMQRFNPETGELSGEASPVRPSSWHDTDTMGSTGISASYSDVLSFLPASLNAEILRVDRNGNVIGSLLPPAPYGDAGMLSQDGKRVCYGMGEPSDLWIAEIGGKPYRFTFHPNDEIDQAWSPDGASIAFSSNRNGPYNIYVKETAGDMSERQLTQSNNWQRVSSWSPDGKYIIYMEINPETKTDLWAYSLQDGKQIPLLTSQVNELNGQISPDGRWIAYVSDESGRSEIYVRPFPDTSKGARWQVSYDGAMVGKWNREGREIVYLTPERKVVSVPVSFLNSFQMGSAEMLFRMQVSRISRGGNVNRDLEVFPDGQSFLLRVPERTNNFSAISILLNWKPR